MQGESQFNQNQNYQGLIYLSGRIFNKNIFRYYELNNLKLYSIYLISRAVVFLQRQEYLEQGSYNISKKCHTFQQSTFQKKGIKQITQKSDLSELRSTSQRDRLLRGTLTTNFLIGLNLCYDVRYLKIHINKTLMQHIRGVTYLKVTARQSAECP